MDGLGISRRPDTCILSLNLPPDLYLLRTNGIDINLNYRYTAPATKDSSRMDISLNNQFLQSFSLTSSQETNRLMLRLPVLQGLLDGKTDVSIPALKLGAVNQLRFNFQYTRTGKALLTRIASEEVVKVPGLGSMLLPGKVGFAEESVWRFNPSYLPPQLASYFTRFGAPWTTLRETNLRLLLETAPKGFSPNWVKYQKKGGWQLSQDASLIGSYDAIRVYLWVGMMNDNDPQKARLLARFKPMATTTIKQGLPPEKVDVATGKRTGDGPVGFSASLLPFLQNRDAQAVQRQHVADRFPDNNAYYSYVLTLFGQGWDQHRFRFTVQGELLPDWGQECARSH